MLTFPFVNVQLHRTLSRASTRRICGLPVFFLALAGLARKISKQPQWGGNEKGRVYALFVPSMPPALFVPSMPLGHMVAAELPVFDIYQELSAIFQLMEGEEECPHLPVAALTSRVNKNAPGEFP